ncbi:unnamed protein product [Aphanomyces euteiches]
MAASASPRDHYTRPLLAFGSKWMKSIAMMKVLVVGLRGLGVDVVRNLMCHGVNAIALLDDDCLREDDIASSTFFDISDVGRKKSVVVKARLAHLNAATRLSTLSGILTSDLLLNYHAVVVTSGPLSREEIAGLSEFCRMQEPPIGVVVAESRGLLASIFVDFGHSHIAEEDESPEFTIVNLDVVGGIVHVREPYIQHMIQAGDLVEFAFCQSPQADAAWLHKLQLLVVEVLSLTALRVHFGVSRLTSFHLNDLPRLKLHKVYGCRSIAHMSYRENIVKPQLVECPYYFAAKDTGRAKQLHAVLQGLYTFRQHHGFFPQPNNIGHGNEILKLTQDFVAQTNSVAASNGLAHAFDPVNATLALEVARCASVEFHPLRHKEVITAAPDFRLVGFGCPLTQVMHWDVLDVLPPVKDLKKETIFHDAARLRESSMLAMFGNEALTRLKHARILVVGCGSVGCEAIQNLSLMGVGTSGPGNVVIDGNQVKLHDVTTQSLFRGDDVGQNKAKVASTRHAKWHPIPAPLQMDDPNIDDKLWTSLDAVVATVEASFIQQLVDEQCFVNEKSVVSGFSTGMTGTVRVYEPHTTQRWVEGQLQDDSASLFLVDRIAMLKASIKPPQPSLAHPIDVTRAFESHRVVRWARTLYDDVFVQSLSCLKLAWTDKINGRSKRRDATFYEFACQAYVRCQALKSVAACIDVAMHVFQTALAPFNVSFNCNDPTHAAFVQVCAVLLSHTMALPMFQDVSLETCRREPLGTPSTLSSTLSAEDFQALSATEMEPVVEPSRVMPFDVMNDSNRHVLFVQTAANVAASVLGIRPIGFFPCKALCGCRADSTATAAIVGGLASIEVVKAVLRKSTCLRQSDYRVFSGLLAFGVPPPPQPLQSIALDATRGTPLRVCPANITLWRKLVVQCTLVPRLLTVEDFLRYLKTKYEVHVERILWRQHSLFATNEQAKLKSSVFELWKAVTGRQSQSPRFLMLDIHSRDNDGDVVLPSIQLLAPRDDTK